MIAGGLCMMGGCFAQDSSARAVDTYWPAHSLHMEKGDVYVFRGLPRVTLPFWNENMRAGAIAENVSWSVEEPGYFSSFGRWEGSFTDALYFGPSVAGGATYGYAPGAMALGIYLSNKYRVYNVIESASPVAKMQLDVKGKEFTVSTENASQTKAILYYPTQAAPAFIKFQSPNFECDMVIYWWRNDVVQQRFFMVQPLKTPVGASAFFIHGYDILTEI